MCGRKWSRICAVTSVLSGLFLTLLSGLYVVKPFTVDAEIVYYGFPFAWLVASRGKPLVITPWHYRFLQWGFVIDFIVYGVLTSAAVYVYITTSARAKTPKTRRKHF
jgi:hypothetical protein